MIGRGAIGNPWIFNQIKHFIKTGTHLPEPTIENRVDVCLTHLKKAIEWKGERVGIIETRAHYGNYFRNLHDFKNFRSRLVTTDSLAEIFDLCEEIRNFYFVEV